ncbi:hypothetical protein BYT27DRAFT_6521387 [Phlegmacium glaucopus]|nr:hypothetical protein BYT27DRAFT_6521387 [Phlegmacium glaucopus]
MQNFQLRTMPRPYIPADLIIAHTFCVSLSEHPLFLRAIKSYPESRCFLSATGPLRPTIRIWTGSSKSPTV